VQPGSSFDREAVAQQGLSEIVRRLAFLPVFVAPVALVALYLAIDDGTPWRRAGLAILGLVGVLGSLRVLTSGQLRRPNWRLVPAKLLLVIGAAASVCALTGGLESPFLPALLPMTFMSALALGPRITSGVVAVLIALVWTFVLLAVTGRVDHFVPAAFGGGPRAGHGDVLLFTAAGVLTVALPWLTFLGGLLRRTYLDVFTRTVQVRDEAVRTHAEHAQVLTALSGEIAHELKNPLASVKGLAALLARDLPEGKAAERLSVLRREVDRMQSTLEEFLNFSRPLVPLQVRAVELGEVAENIVALHEGMARERGVGLQLDRVATPVSCDPRKIGQVLVNLVQNAIEASGPGGTVEIEVRGESGRARVDVRDRGRGLDPGLGERVFEPGVTTKDRGSGLGLSIARGLARQHGGELVLGPREGGGTVATLTLPAAAHGEAA
jgi:two-component system sensor histidine kinase HydH